MRRQQGHLASEVVPLAVNHLVGGACFVLRQEHATAEIRQLVDEDLRMKWVGLDESILSPLTLRPLELR